jgi:hypothetical protein
LQPLLERALGSAKALRAALSDAAHAYRDFGAAAGAAGGGQHAGRLTGWDLGAENLALTAAGEALRGTEKAVMKAVEANTRLVIEPLRFHARSSLTIDRELLFRWL